MLMLFRDIISDRRKGIFGKGPGGVIHAKRSDKPKILCRVTLEDLAFPVSLWPACFFQTEARFPRSAYDRGLNPCEPMQNFRGHFATL